MSLYVIVINIGITSIEETTWTSASKVGQKKTGITDPLLFHFSVFACTLHSH